MQHRISYSLQNSYIASYIIVVVAALRTEYKNAPAHSYFYEKRGGASIVSAPSGV